MADKQTSGMQYVRLGKTGLKVSKISKDPSDWGALIPASSRLHVIWLFKVGRMGLGRRQSSSPS